MLNSVVFLVGSLSTLLVVISVAITWREFRRMNAAEPSRPAPSPRTPAP